MKRSFKRTTLILLLVVFSAPLMAQSSFSLEQAIQYALLNNENLKNAKLNIGDAEAQVYETRADGLPQLNAAFGYTNNFEIPVSIIPANSFDPTAPEGEITAVRFGVQHQTQFGVTASQMLWDGAFFIGLQAARKLREKVVVDEAKAIEDVKEQVMKAYYLVLVNQVRTDIVESNIATLDSTLSDTKALFENGFAESIDVSRLQVQMNNLLAEQSAVRQAITSAKNLLKLSMGYDVNAPIGLTDRLRTFDFTYDAQEIENFNVVERTEYQQLDYLKQLAVLDIKNVKSQYIPTVSLNAGWGRNTGRDNFNQLWNDERIWFTNSNVGLSVNIPIFDGLRKKYSIQRRQFQLETLENQSDLLKNDLKQRLINSKVALDVSMERLKVQEQTVQLAEEVLNTTTAKYREGIGSNLELIVADQDYKQAEVNFLIALYDAIVAKIDLDKALGNLN